MQLALMPNPDGQQRHEFQDVGLLLDKLRPDQHIRLQKILSSWGLQRHGLPLPNVKRAIRKVLQNYP
jgi:hypothetical protein